MYISGDGMILTGAGNFSSSSNYPDWVRVPINLPFIASEIYFPGVKQPGHEVDHLSGIELKNDRCCLPIRRGTGVFMNVLVREYHAVNN
jgi:hypothetical protein